jgi:hypothetical protein
MALPVFQAAGTPVAVGAAAASPGWPSHIAGDVAFLIVETSGADEISLSTPAGFSPVANGYAATEGTNLTRLSVYWCRATSGAMGAPTIAAPANHAYAQIITYRGCVSTGDPWEAFVWGHKDTASTTTTWKTLRTVTNDCLIALFAARGNDNAAAAWSAFSNGALSSLSERADAGTATGNGGGIVAADGGLATAGLTGATTATVTSAPDVTLAIALRSQFPSSGPYMKQAMQTVPASPNALTFVETPTAGNLIVVAVARFNDDPAAGEVTDNQGNTYTLIGSAINDGNSNHIAFYYAKNIAASGAFTISIAGADNKVVAHEFVGLDTTAPLDQNNSATNAGSTTPSTSVTTAIDGELYFVATTDGGDDYDTPVPNTNYQLAGQGLIISVDMRIATEFRVTNQGTITGDMTLEGSFSWAILMASFKPASGAPADTSKMLQMF